MYICDEGVAEKQMADTYEKAVAVEGTENATGNSSEVRRFFGAQGETSPLKIKTNNTSFRIFAFSAVTLKTPARQLRHSDNCGIHSFFSPRFMLYSPVL